MRRFVQEAKAASALNHPNILIVHDVGRSDSIPYMVTEHVQGDTLRTRLRKGPLPLAEALDVAIQIASALTEAHHAGIIHRDVKPENVMVRSGGLVKLLVCWAWAGCTPTSRTTDDTRAYFMPDRRLECGCDGLPESDRPASQ